MSFAAVAEPTRREILDLLRDGERPVGELVDRLGMSQPAVSKHLRVLREAGLVEMEARGRARIYRLVPGGITEVRRWVEETGRFWDSALESFRRHVEEREVSG